MQHIRNTVISIHALLAESDRGRIVHAFLCMFISIHALLAESDFGIQPQFPAHQIFLSTLSLRRATCIASWCPKPISFLSTLSLRRATVDNVYLLQYDVDISIHALLAESDRTGLTCGGGKIISIHALLAESDPVICFIVSVICLFLSTLSLRRATGRNISLLDTSSFLSTLSLRRATFARAGWL